ncbi:MAG TPA: translation initiation factor IF-3 [Terriglobia bacterium]|nr:translation initiation factor IF-3 [Terriglobia bacterium]
MNERIRAREVRVIDEEGNQLGIMPPFEALKIARGSGLDLVEVAPTANPPVCRIINYGKYLYQLNKRQHEARKHQKSVGLKEVKMRPRTSAHDFETKRNKIVEFLQEGAKVKVTIMFRGREMAHRNLGFQMMDRLIEAVGDAGAVEVRPKFEGPNLSVIIAAKKAAGKTAAKPAAAGASPSPPPSKPAVTPPSAPPAPRPGSAPESSGG